MLPNVLVVQVDCLRADRAASGQTFAVTPTIDRLRGSGAAFSQAIAAATTTTPCTAAWLTGCYAARHGVRGHSGHKLRPGVPTLAEVLARAGYYTWAEVTGPLFPETELNRGFRDYHWRGRGQYLDGAWGKALRQRLPQLPRPWFGLIHLWELHLPRHVPRAFDRAAFGLTLYDRAMSALDHQLGRLLECLPPGTLLVVQGDHGEAVHPSMLKARWRNFYMSLAGHAPLALQQMARPFVKHLKMQGRGRSQWENLGHGFHVYEYLVRVPLIFSGPGIPAGVTVASQVRMVDMPLTLVDALGLEWIGSAHGRSLLPLARGQSLPELPAFSDACGRVLLEEKWWRSGIRAGGYKYVYGPNNPGLPEELYDLAVDPDERNSLVHEQPELAARLKTQLLQAITDDGAAE
jgi:arylsulfatase A-like enzyme